MRLVGRTYRHALIGAIFTTLVGCGQSLPQSSPDSSNPQSRDEVLQQMRQSHATTRKAVATPPPTEVMKRLVGAWRIDARFRDGKWQSMRQAGSMQDVAFNADGTLQAYMGTLGKWDGAYEVRPGDGCVDVRATVGESKPPFTYEFSVAFEGGMLLMTEWQRMDFAKTRLFKNIDEGKAKNSLNRFYRVKGFAAEE